MLLQKCYFYIIFVRKIVNPMSQLQLPLQVTEQNATKKVLPKSLTKSQLCEIFGNGTRPCSKMVLHTKFLKPTFVKDYLKIEWDEFRRIKMFDFEQTRIICQYFDISIEDL